MAGKGDGKGVQRRQVNHLLGRAIDLNQQAEALVQQARNVCEFFGLNFDAHVAKVKADSASAASPKTGNEGADQAA